MLWYCSFLKGWWQENERTPTKHFVKNATAKYNVPKNILPTWVKNKEKRFNAVKKGTNVKIKKFKSDNHELVDQAILNWFLNIRSQNVPLSASMVQEKAVIFAKELNIENFHASDGYHAGKK